MYSLKNVINFVSFMLFLLAFAKPALAQQPLDLAKSPEIQKPEFSNFASEWISKARKYLNKHNKCYAAVMIFETAKQANYFEAEHMMPQSVICFADLISDPATINEKEGCRLSSLNIKSGMYSNYGNIMYREAYSPKKCVNGGFEEIISMKALRSPSHSGYNPSFEEDIFEPNIETKEGPTFALIFSSENKLQKWFDARVSIQKIAQIKTREKYEKRASKQKTKN